MDYLLEVKNVSKKFGDHTILKDVSFNIKPGEIVGLVGRNGMGKTTLMKCILGLIKIDTGEIIFKGKTEYDTNKAFMDEIGYLLDCKLFENLNAYENIKIQEWYKGQHYSKMEEKRVIENILNLVDLKNDKKKVKQYSFGMKQRLGLALALLGDPKLLILDEPFVGLDPVGIQTIREFILKVSKERKMAILISSHQLSEIEGISQRYLFISDRQLTNCKNDNRKKVMIYTNEQIPEEIKCLLSNDSKVENRMLSFWFDVNVFNSVIECLVRNKVTVTDIELQKVALDILFKGEKV